jgi:hypothetical protein
LADYLQKLDAIAEAINQWGQVRQGLCVDWFPLTVFCFPWTVFCFLLSVLCLLLGDLEFDLRVEYI